MFAVRKLFHLTQIVDDLDLADRWYNRLFSPCRFYRGYMKEAVRHASLLAIGDATVVEPVQLADEPGAEQSPLGRFRARFGARLHSIAWYVDDLDSAVDTLLGHGVRLVDVAGRPIESREQAAGVKYVWTHPKDSHGPLEFARLNAEFSTDPRVQPHWSAAYWREQHPLGIDGLLRITLATRLPEQASRFYTQVLGAREAASLPGQPGRSLQVGDDTIVDLVDAGSERFGAFGEGVFGMSFQVRDIARAEAFLREAGLPVVRRSDCQLELAPQHALGATVGFHQAAGVR
ncbi:VOC family protein [Pseudorhodoferax sp.]|uniref:VOC family protein n=1 Tax=Pseudorhodoferax sp. TaxID=1993553 RepID=UPI002DD65CC6|nr:VOC family protein [Pseudorhodoferax sp.]